MRRNGLHAAAQRKNVQSYPQSNLARAMVAVSQ